MGVVMLAMLVAQAQPAAIAPERGVRAAPVAPATLRLRGPALRAEGRRLVARVKAVLPAYHPAIGSGQPSKAEIAVLLDRIKGAIDAKSELGETESLRLQMAMDRVSKFMTALSNIEKKASDTDSAMVQNVK